MKLKFGGAELEFVYDDKGRLSEIWNVDNPDSKSKLVYDGENKIIKRIFVTSDVEDNYVEYVYNDEDEIISSTYHEASGEKTSTATYDYDDNHRIIEYKSKFVGDPNFNTHVTFEYYANGNLKESTSYEDGKEIGSTDYVEYDTKVNPLSLHPFLQFMSTNYSKNNVGRWINTYNETFDETLFTYEYSNKNLPRSITYVISPSGADETTMPEYSCD